MDEKDREVYQGEAPLPDGVDNAFAEYKRMQKKAKLRRALNEKFKRFVVEEVQKKEIGPQSTDHQIAEKYLNRISQVEYDQYRDAAIDPED